jgi:Transglycosylase SLT domain
MAVPYLACMAAAAAFYHLPPRVLPSIQAVEGGQPGLVQMNSNQTADLGVMQVNTIWVQPLAQYAHMSPSVVMARLKSDPCFNIAAAAAIMRYALTEAHGNLMVAIGYYHSHTPTLSQEYQQKVMAAAMAMFVRHEAYHANGTQRTDR